MLGQVFSIAAVYEFFFIFFGCMQLLLQANSNKALALLFSLELA